MTLACDVHVNDIVSGKSIVSPSAKQGLVPLTIPLVRISPGMIGDTFINLKTHP